MVLLLGGVLIAFTWTENYGERRAGDAAGSLYDSFAKGAATIARDRRVLLLGAITSCFEAAMYSFVFEWTPAVTPADGPKPPYGEIFSVMMVCCMAGTRLFNVLAESAPPEGFMRGLFAVAAVALAAPIVFSGNPVACLGAFLAFEVVVGCYFPAFGTLKGKVIPDAHRATIYNLFRVPLNVLVLGVLLSHLDTLRVFIAVVSLLASAAVLCHALVGTMAHHEKRSIGGPPDNVEPLIAV